VSIDQYITASLVIIIVQWLKNVCKNMKNQNYSLRVLGLINNLLNGKKDHQYWENIENNKTLKICTFFDLQFKNIPFTYNEKLLTSGAHRESQGWRLTSLTELVDD
jgi:hypothetical protein